jgi:hypothetical protein
MSWQKCGRSSATRAAPIALGAIEIRRFGSIASKRPVIDTDFRIGGSIDLRPWCDGWEHLSLSVGFFHESTHGGSEFKSVFRQRRVSDKPLSVNSLLEFPGPYGPCREC